MVAQACSALAYCHHKLFLLHRDIKPQNIFLSASGDVKIGDFGISKCLSASHGLALTKCGSPLYMSPELCSGRPYDRGHRGWTK
ncbi:serine threonine-protein kinase [Chrysochromulina tobinii]|uniref:non-specific serine/threonine protein kinase n=1 Tax=Chrysochromulina tobinii TaxID=1460289 RepID=A0A0M0JS42_9EUKA|nr:serine threonine-protein kinase [Chrysochromulina tobinii]|eukprot:KOO29325.1 serine threonine-protein kinase [Chrysochromulina sp. CCMP291]